MTANTLKNAAVWIAILMFGCGLVLAAFHFDRPLRNGIVEVQGKKFKKTQTHRMLGTISRYGDWPQLMVVGGLIFGLAYWRKRRDWMKIIAAAMIASTVAGLITVTIRSTTGRPRPRAEAELGTKWYGPWHWEKGELLIGKSSYNSFPSGHTATAMGFAAVIVYARPLIGLLALLPALAISASRIGLGAHHLSDVTVATLLAFLVAWLTWGWVSRYAEDRGW